MHKSKALRLLVWAFFCSMSFYIRGRFTKMLDKLQSKWGVSPLGLFLVICTFAIGGSLAGFLAKKVMNLLSVEQDWLYGICYLIAVTLLWPLSVITVSVFFGQFKFFSAYLRKLGRKFGLIRPQEE